MRLEMLFKLHELFTLKYSNVGVNLFKQKVGFLEFSFLTQNSGIDHSEPKMALC